MPARLLVDTGASRTVFDLERVRNFLPEEALIEKLDKLSAGLGTNTMESHALVLRKLKIGEFSLKKFPVVAIDMKHVNESYGMLGMEPVDGVLGSDLLQRYGAVIDYTRNRMTLRHKRKK
jgi:hypothetical protein